MFEEEEGREADKEKMEKEDKYDEELMQREL